jgi:diacylglycerol kinase (ATP)
MTEHKEWLVIVNPNAGVGKCSRNWSAIRKSLQDRKIKFDIFFSDYRKHALEIVHQNLAYYSKIIVVGGDGTFNEVINGIFSQNQQAPKNIIIGYIPMGSGNDLAKMYGISEDFEDAIQTIVNGKLFIQDIGKVTFQNVENTTESRYFANIAGLGFDARVVEKSNKQKDKGHGGKLLYLFNLFSSIFSYTSNSVSVKTENTAFTENIFSMNIGICRYSGGGMLQVPDAIPDDGLFDITIIKKIGTFDILSSIKKLYNGTIKKHPKVKSLQAAYIEITSDKKIQLEADGEDFGYSPVKFEIVEKAISIIIKNPTFTLENQNHA